MPALVSEWRTAPAGASPPRGWDLFSLAPVRRLVLSSLYPGVFQAVSVVVFGLVVYFGLWGTVRPGQNFATTVTWTVWWALLPVSFFLVGRAWCAVCPVVPGMSLVQRAVHPSQMPGRLLRRNGVWLMGL